VPNSETADELTGRLDRIPANRLIREVSGDAVEQQELAERIHREILAARQAPNPVE
jgi:hypothetical protein